MRSLAVAAQQAINNTEKEKALVTAALVARQLQVLLLCCALLCRWQIPLKSKTKHLLYIAFQRCSSTVKKQHTDTGFRAVLAALFSFVQVAVFEPNFF